MQLWGRIVLNPLPEVCSWTCQSADETSYFIKSCSWSQLITIKEVHSWGLYMSIVCYFGVIYQSLDNTSNSSQRTNERTRMWISFQTSQSYLHESQQLAVLEFRCLLESLPQSAKKMRFIYLFKWEKHTEMFCHSQQTTTFPQNKLACNISKPIKDVINETQHL